MKKIVILGFLPHGIATAEHKTFAKQAAEHGVKVHFRNAHHVADDHKPEDCDGVTDFETGCLPKIYANHPTAAEVVRVNMEEIERRRALVGDTAPERDLSGGGDGEGDTQVSDGEKKQPAAGKKAAPGWKTNQ